MMPTDDEQQHAPLRHLTESEWDRLPADQHTDAIRRQQRDLIDRHNALLSGQRALDTRVRDNAAATMLLSQRVDQIATNLAANTLVTMQTKATADDVKKDTAEIVKLFNNARITVSTLDAVTKAVVRVGVPGGLIFGLYKATAPYFGRLVDWLAR